MSLGSDDMSNVPGPTLHTFVQLTMIPVEATLQPDGSIDLHVTEAAEEISVEQAKVGCWFCGVPLDTETVNQECVGVG